MKLLVVRHGPAGERAEWEAQGRDDRLRPLTLEGKKEVRRVARGLATVVTKIDRLATSPLVRAIQTAEVIAAEYDCDFVQVEALAPGNDPGEVLKWLQQQRGDTIAVVGHEPDLSALVGYLLTAKPATFLTLKKSGTVLIDLEDSPRPGNVKLEWLLVPRVLKQLAK
jgi:phosphohistidine phosphatase